ncbi:MAG: hypothetical protein KIT84_43095 [Labilithrix sp.]|nr:hypothetical protein [Labilithrix sp.]MCW5817867.1 hypothetical protein [Labilithrix sp.]
MSSSEKKESKKDAPELAEVERALSILHGRHPEHERVRREGEEQKAARAREHEVEHRAVARRILRRRLRLGAVAVVILGALGVIAGSLIRETNRTKALDAAAAPFAALGFTVVETSARGDPTKLAASVETGCIVATSVTPSSKLKLAHPGGVIEGSAPIVTCLCEPASVTITSDRAAQGMVLLRVDASAIGGSRAYPFLPFSPGTTATIDTACAEAELDAWLDAKKAPSLAAGGERANADLTALRAAGFKPAITIPPAKPFGLVEVPAASCALVLQSEPRPVSLRQKGGALAMGPHAGNIGWCTSAAATVLVQREPGPAPTDEQSAVDVLIAPAGKLGGLLGMHEAAKKDGVAIAATAVPPNDREWIAKELLTASWVPASLVTTGIERVDDEKELRIASLSVAKTGTLNPETAEGIFSFCDPPLESAVASLCVFSGLSRWRVEGDAVTGLARAKTPFWLFAFKDATEPAALMRETQLITLARRLKREGFEPTTIEAVTETDAGAEVLGRANEDAVVALTIAPVDPWVFPLAAKDAPPWTLDGEPRSAPIKPLERIVLVPAPKTRLPPKAARRTVVFRRHE